jgi:O-succinylbenzoic acid--CoA ligase
MHETHWPLSITADLHPDEIAVNGPDGPISYLEFDQRVRTASETLAEAGIQPGHRVAIAAAPSLASLTALLGCIRLGAAAVPHNTRWPESAMSDSIESLGCPLIINDEDHQVESSAKAIHVSQFDRYTLKAQEPPPRIDPDQTAVIVYTSGSGGDPKPAALSFENLHHNAAQSNRNIELDPGDAWSLSLPIYHVSGLGVIFRCLASGATIAIPGPEEDIPEACVKYRVTHLSLVATQLYRLIQFGSGLNALRNTKAILLGGSAIPESLIRAAIDNRLPIHTTYGMTEMASQITTTRANESVEALLTSGRPLNPNAVKLTPDGEILIRGECLFKGYIEDNHTILNLIDGAWFATGDRGAFNAKGCLTVFGRKDNQFISGGENIQPEEIEKFLTLLDGVEEAIVVPVADDEFGQRPIAFIKAEGHYTIDARTIADALSRHLPGYKIPRSFYPWPDHLPEGGIKVSRTKLQSIAEWLARQAS